MLEKRNAHSGSGKLKLSLFGGFRLEDSDGCLISVTSKKSRALIAYLALTKRGEALREKLASLTWSDRGDKQAKDSLRQCISSLRRQLLPLCPGFLDLDRKDVVAINLDSVWIDVREMERLAADGDADFAGFVRQFVIGRFLENLEIEDYSFREWVDSERCRLDDSILQSLRTKLDGLLTRESFAEALDVARLILKTEPTCEQSHRACMRIFHQQGDLAGAVKQYGLARKTLRDSLDVEPSDETTGLYESLKSKSRGWSSRDIRTGPKQPADQSRQMPVPQEAATSSHALPNRTKIGLAALPPDLDRIDPGPRFLMERCSKELVSTLSTIPWLTVFGHYSTFGILSRQIDVRGISNILPTDYLLDFRVYGHEQNFFLSVEIIFCKTAETIWAENRSFLSEAEIREFEDLAPLLANLVETQIRMHQAKLSRRSNTLNLSPRKLVFKATPLIFRMTAESLDEAGSLLNSALELEPSDANSTSWTAFLELIRIGQGWVTDPKSSLEKIDQLTRIALELDPGNSQAWAIRGHVLSFVFHRFQAGLACFERALKCNKFDPMAWAFSALTYCYIGDLDEAISRLHRYRELSPYDPHDFFFQTGFCLCHAMAGRHSQAIEAGRLAIEGNPNFFAAYRPLVSSLGHEGKIEEAKPHLDALLKNNPEFSIEWMRTKYPPINEDQFENFTTGLQLAGVPLS